MPVFVFTFHGYCTWLPDNPKGYVERGKGVRPPNERMARLYRLAATHDEQVLSDHDQQLLVEEAQRACLHQGLMLHLVATEPTHVHVLVSWTSDKSFKRVQAAVKQSFTRALRADRGDQRPIFSRGAGHTQIRDQAHFDHWMHEYGPSHTGWKWRADKGTYK